MHITLNSNWNSIFDTVNLKNASAILPEAISAGGIDSHLIYKTRSQRWYRIYIRIAGSGDSASHSVKEIIYFPS